MKTFDAHTSPSSSPAGRCVARRMVIRVRLSSFFFCSDGAGTKQAHCAHDASHLLQAPGGSSSRQAVGNNYLNTVWHHERSWPGHASSRRHGYGRSATERFISPRIQVTLSGAWRQPTAGRCHGFVSTNFAHPAAQVLQNCPSTAACTASGGYSAMSTVAGAPSTVVAAPGSATATVTAGLGIFLPDNNGASGICRGR